MAKFLRVRGAIFVRQQFPASEGSLWRLWIDELPAHARARRKSAPYLGISKLE
jgi:hypothetical protein